MKKKMICMAMAAAMTAGLLTGCGGSTASGTTASDSGEVNVFIWTEYLPDSVVKEFEEKTGIKVNLSTYSSNEDLLAKLKSESEGTYDVIVPSDYMVEQLIGQDMLEKLDKEKLTNFDNLGEAYLNPSYDPGNEYTVAYQGGVAAIAVNTAKVDLEITTYDDLFAPELANSLVMLDDFRAIIGITERSMGYSMNETDPDILSKVQDKLLTLKPNIKLYDSDSPKSAMISGDCVAGVMWSAEVALAMEENPEIQIVYPKEGAYLFMDNLAIAKGAKNYDNALKFIDFILDADVSTEISAEFPYLNPNAAAVEAMGEEYSANPAKNPPADVFSAGEYISNLDVDTLAIYDEMWTKLKE